MNKYLIPLARDERLANAAYVPQIEARELIDDWLKLPRNDEFLCRPSTNWCALCCVSMILRFVRYRSPSLEALYESAFQARVYDFVKDRVVGAVHASLAQWIGAQEDRLFAKPVRCQTKGDVEHWLRAGCFVMASVSPQIRSHNAQSPSFKGGHFVLLYGWYADDNGGGVILHDSAGLYHANTQVHVHVSWEWFLQCFSGNAVVVKVLDL